MFWWCRQNTWIVMNMQSILQNTWEYLRHLQNMFLRFLEIPWGSGAQALEFKQATGPLGEAKSRAHSGLAHWDHLRSQRPPRDTKGMGLVCVISSLPWRWTDVDRCWQMLTVCGSHVDHVRYLNVTEVFLQPSSQHVSWQTWSQQRLLSVAQQTTASLRWPIHCYAMTNSSHRPCWQRILQTSKFAPDWSSSAIAKSQELPNFQKCCAIQALEVNDGIPTKKFFDSLVLLTPYVKELFPIFLALPR